MFYMTYIYKAPREQNAFAQWGAFCHKILEKYYKHEIELFDMGDEYASRYLDEVTLDFPENQYVDLSSSYIETGAKYFNEFEDSFIGYKVIAVENVFKTKVGGHNITGVIDLVVKDGDEYIIVDHKSKSGFKSDSEKRHYLFQLYIYSKYIYEVYGRFPSKLIYNMFRKGDIIVEKFDKEEYDKALSWAENTINQIYDDEEFIDKIEAKYLSSRGKKQLSDFPRNDFFCNELCNSRSLCERSIKYKAE